MVEEDRVGDIIEASFDIEEAYGGTQARAVSCVDLVHQAGCSVLG